jgi:hypothetical protein
VLLALYSEQLLCVAVQSLGLITEAYKICCLVPVCMELMLACPQLVADTWCSCQTRGAPVNSMHASICQ